MFALCLLHGCVSSVRQVPRNRRGEPQPGNLPADRPFQGLARQGGEDGALSSRRIANSLTRTPSESVGCSVDSSQTSATRGQKAGTKAVAPHHGKPGRAGVFSCRGSQTCCRCYPDEHKAEDRVCGSVRRPAGILLLIEQHRRTPSHRR